MAHSNPLSFLKPIARVGLILTGLLAVLAPMPGPPPGWVNVAGPGLAAVEDVLGVSWGDYDGDGDPDLYLSRVADNRLFRNDGGDQFVDVTPTILADADRGNSGVWGDADNDGDLDLYLVKPDNLDTNRFFRNDAGSFVDATTSALGLSGASREATWVDLDGDGDLDLYVVRHPDCQLLRNDAGVFVDATPAPLSGVDYPEDAAWRDIDLDQDPDVYLVGFTEGSSRLCRNEAGTFADASQLILLGGAQTNSAAWVDVDNDGDSDLSVLATYYASELYRNQGDGTFASATPSSFDLIRSHLGGQVWGDFDNDGDPDLFVNQRNGYAKLLYRNDGNGNLVEVGEAPLRNTVQGAGAAAADYDGDGDLDLFVANYPGESQLFRNENSSGHWLEIELIGTLSNRFGVGATIRVVTPSRSQIREISGGGAGNSQDDPVVHFGLGADSEISSILVYWPSGAIQTVDDGVVDSRITVTEIETTGVTGNRTPEVRARLLSASPNPFRATTRIHFELEHPGPVRLRILDAQGREVRALEMAGRTGSQEAAWDGRDDQGSRVPQGVYWIVLDAGRERWTGKLIRLN